MGKKHLRIPFLITGLAILENLENANTVIDNKLNINIIFVNPTGVIMLL